MRPHTVEDCSSSRAVPLEPSEGRGLVQYKVRKKRSQPVARGDTLKGFSRGLFSPATDDAAT
jgi:hypothetical protein